MIALTDNQKTEIKKQFDEMQNLNEFANLLQYVYNSIFADAPKNKKPIVIESKILTYWAFKKNIRYKEFVIPKKSGGTRTISSPFGMLKKYQQLINIIFQCVFSHHGCSYGFVPEKSIVDNAKQHVSRRYVYNIDLKDFFPSVSFRRVKTVLGLAPFNLTDEIEQNNTISKGEEKRATTGRGYIGYVIANLCSENNGLPQGAPTSPILTNIVCQRLDRKLKKLAKRYRAIYTRYADDITFSANKHIFNDVFKAELNSIIVEQEKFDINFKKERLQSSSMRQEVTGIKVNQKLNIDRKYLQTIRFWLRDWEKRGYDDASIKFQIDYMKEKGFMRYNGKIPNLENVLMGKILYLGMVKGKEDNTFKKCQSRLNTLISKGDYLDREITKSDSKNTKKKEFAEVFAEVFEKRGIEDALKYFENYLSSY